MDVFMNIIRHTFIFRFDVILRELYAFDYFLKNLKNLSEETKGK